VSITASRSQRRQFERDNAKQPIELRKLPRELWASNPPPQLETVFRSRDFLVQVFTESGGAIARLSVCRTELSGDRWKDGIEWEELQRIKRECGYGNRDAVEVFPSDADVVNVANMRHLWILEAPASFAWRKA